MNFICNLESWYNPNKNYLWHFYLLPGHFPPALFLIKIWNPFSTNKILVSDLKNYKRIWVFMYFLFVSIFEFSFCFYFNTYIFSMKSKYINNNIFILNYIYIDNHIFNCFLFSFYYINGVKRKYKVILTICVLYGVVT